MKILTQWLTGAITAVVVILLSSPAAAHADNYQIFSLGSASGSSLYGIDAAGSVVLYNSQCAVTSISCFETYVNGAGVSGSSSAPSLGWDDGTSCGIAGYITSRTACNGGWTAFGNPYLDNGLAGGLYTLTGSDLDFIHSGSVDKLFINSAGDIAWTDGMSGQIFEAVDMSAPVFEASFNKESVPVTTPEPGSLLLLATGFAGMTFALRRKVNS